MTKIVAHRGASAEAPENTLQAFAKAIEADGDCYRVMQLLSSCRGALNGLMGEVVEGHIREHVVEAENKKLAMEAGEELIEIMQSFWK